MMFFRRALLVGLILNSVNVVFAAQPIDIPDQSTDISGNPLDTTLADFEFDKAYTINFVRQFCVDTGINVGIYMWPDSNGADTQSSQIDIYLDLESPTAREILDEFVAQRPQYIWTELAPGFVNILPRSLSEDPESVFYQELPPFAVQDQTATEAVRRFLAHCNDIPNKKKHLLTCPQFMYQRQ